MKMDFLFTTKTNSRKFQQAIKTYRAEHLEDVEAVTPDDKAGGFISQN
jgi:hypothetical protein